MLEFTVRIFRQVFHVQILLIFFNHPQNIIIFFTYYNVVNAEDSCKLRKEFMGILVKERVQEQVELFTKSIISVC